MATSTKAMVPRKSSAVTAKGQEVQLVEVTFDDVKNFLCPKATDKEIGMFLNICQAEQLNPFQREIWLVKISDTEPAAVIISEEAYLKAAESNTQYNGHEAGIILQHDGKYEYRAGTFMMPQERDALVGGWAKVYRNDREVPFYTAVPLAEVQKVTREGKPTRFWQAQPAQMVRKVALHRALKEAFPNRFAGKTSSAMIEGEFREAFETAEGDSDWAKFWARQTEKGVKDEEVHQILGVESVKDWLEQGKTLAEAEEAINRWLRARAAGANPDTGEILEVSGKGPVESGSISESAASPDTPPAKKAETKGPKTETKQAPAETKPVTKGTKAPEKKPEPAKIDVEKLAKDVLGEDGVTSFVMPEMVRLFGEKARLPDLDAKQLESLAINIRGERVRRDNARQVSLRRELGKVLIEGKGLPKEEALAWVKENLGVTTTEAMTIEELEAAVDKAKNYQPAAGLDGDLPF